MCNYLHADSRAIPQKGFGYKLFSLSGSPLTYDGTYKASEQGWIIWSDRYVMSHQFIGAITDSVKQKMGFCFFMSLREAKKARHLWGSPCHLMRIEYNRGLGRHLEHKFCEEASIDMAICREFRIITEWTVLERRGKV